MSATFERSDGNLKIYFSVTPEKFEEAVQSVYIKNKNRISLPGFRKGKVARQMIEAYYGKNFFYADAVDQLLQPAYLEALEELADEINPIGPPEVEVTEISKETGVKFLVEILEEPAADISDYKGLEFSAEKKEVTDAGVDEEIENIRNKNSRLVTVSDRPSKTDDDLIIDFKGYMEDEAFDGGEAENYNIVIGSGALIDTFEQQLIGHNIGDEFEVHVTFPDDYDKEEFAGRNAMFEVRINDIRERVLPDLDDDFAQDISEFDTLDEFREDLREQLIKKAEENYNSEKRAQILIKLAEKCEADIPDCMVNDAIEARVEDIKQAFGGYITMEQYAGFMGITQEELRARLEKEANEIVRFRLALMKIAEYEDITVTEEDVTEKINDGLSKTHYRFDDDYKKRLLTSKSHRKSVKRDIMMERALDTVCESAVFVKKEEEENA